MDSATPEPFAWPGGARAALSLSFDDARRSQIDRGMTILDARGVKATFYVSPGGVSERLDGWTGVPRVAIGGHDHGHAVPQSSQRRGQRAANVG